VQAIRHRRSLTAAFNTKVLAVPGRTVKVLRDGLVVGFANPKSIVFLAAMLPQFVDRVRGAVPAQILVLGIALPVIALLSDSVWALAAGSDRAWFARSPRCLELIGGTGGLVMIGLGTTLAVTATRTDRRDARPPCSSPKREDHSTLLAETSLERMLFSTAVVCGFFVGGDL
jgi:threonine/homoserine/homoserine lactone efflux protein